MFEAKAKEVLQGFFKTLPVLLRKVESFSLAGSMTKLRVSYSATILSLSHRMPGLILSSQKVGKTSSQGELLEGSQERLVY